MNRKTKKQESSVEEDSFYDTEENTSSLLKSFEGESVDLMDNESLFGNANPYEQSSLMSRWFFSWVTPLVRFGYGSKITLDNLGSLPSSYHCSKQEARVNAYWTKYKHRTGFPLIWAI